MKINSTTNDISKIAFIENLYKEMRKQTQSAIEDRDRFIAKASLYLEDGLSSTECSELLVIEGLERDVAENYVRLAQTDSPIIAGRHEYSFQFEDVYGKIWSSYDIDRTVHAACDEEAWELAEGQIFNDSSIELDKIVAVDRIS